MEKFKFRLEETLSRDIEIEAKNKEEAYDKLRELYFTEEIILTEEDYSYTEVCQLNDNNEEISNFDIL